jgi:hypothetical protein
VYEVFNELKEVLKTHIGLNKEEEYDILTLWIIGTYVHTCFNSYPYLFFYGAKGCGKSNALKVLSYFSFNGMFLARPSASNVFRLVNTLQCTLAINDLDNIRMYPIYSPKALAGSKILADMIKDRSIEFIMIKSDTSYPTFIDNNFSAELRDKLYILALEIWKDVMREYANLESNTSIQGREKEKWQGLLALGNAFQMDYKNLQEFALFKINEHLEEEMIDSEERNILRVLNGLVIGDQWYYAKDLKDGYIEYLRSIDENVDYVRERYVVKLIKKIGLISEKGLTHGKARLLIKRSALNSIMKSYGFKDSDINLG